MSEKALAYADLNQGFVVAIEIVAKAGEENAVASALEALIKPTMAEPGVKLFLPYRSPTDPAAFFIFELYFVAPVPGCVLQFKLNCFPIEVILTQAFKEP